MYCLRMRPFFWFWSLAFFLALPSAVQGTFCYDPHKEDPSDDGHSKSSISVGIAIKNLLLIVQV